MAAVAPQASAKAAASLASSTGLHRPQPVALRARQRRETCQQRPTDAAAAVGQHLDPGRHPGRLVPAAPQHAAGTEQEAVRVVRRQHHRIGLRQLR
ncbi:hypothetical protein [Sphingomonas sp.]|uniref:hypothetical protein n=1 Tax=Sphingomonas sp. TaxID=28214 RepID=UPI003AFF9E5B